MMNGSVGRFFFGRKKEFLDLAIEMHQHPRVISDAGVVQW